MAVQNPQLPPNFQSASPELTQAWLVDFVNSLTRQWQQAMSIINGLVANVNAGIMNSFALQAPTVVAVAINAVAVTNVINVTEGGKLLAVGVKLETANVNNAPTVTLDVNTNAAGAQSVKLYTAANTFDPGITAFINTNTGGGATAPDSLWFPIGVEYETSLKVDLNVVGATLAACVLRITLLRGKKL